MRILFTRFPLESRRGGAENQTVSLMEGLLARGNAVSFLGSCPSLLTMCTERNIPNAKLAIGPPPVSRWTAATFPWRKGKMERKLRETFDTFRDLHAVFMLSLSEKILLTPHALEQGVRVFWQEHDTVGLWLARNPWLPALRRMSAGVTTVCVSELSAEIYRKLGFANVVAIPNGVPAPKNFVPHTFDGTLRIGCIARLATEKGVDLLAEAVRDFADVRLLINGSGPVRIAHAKNIEIRSHVGDVEEVYRAIDAFILPSRVNDPFGLVVAEAMLRGIPVLCTTACGISRYLVNGEEAIVIPAGSIGALQEGIKLLRDPAVRERLAANGKRAAEEKFTVEKMTEGYVGLLRQTR